MFCESVIPCWLIFLLTLLEWGRFFVKEKHLFYSFKKPYFIVYFLGTLGVHPQALLHSCRAADIPQQLLEKGFMLRDHRWCQLPEYDKLDLDPEQKDSLFYFEVHES